MMLARPLARLGSLLVLLCAAGCAPTTQFANVAVDYHASPNVSVQMNRLTGSAVAYSDADADALNRAGAVYLGELDVYGRRGGLISGGSGPGNLAGRASLEAAERGASHYMLLSGDVGRVSTGNTVIVSRYGATVIPNSEQQVTARYALVRVDPVRWPELPAALRPAT